MKTSRNKNNISIINTIRKNKQTITTNIENITNAISIKDGVFFGGLNGLYYTQKNDVKPIKVSDDEIVAISNVKNNKILFGTSNFEIKEIDIESKKVTPKLVLNKKLPIFEIKIISNEKYIVATQAGLIEIGYGIERTVYDSGIVYSIAHKDDITYFGTKSAIYYYSHKNN